MGHTILPSLSPTTSILAFQHSLAPLEAIPTKGLATPEADGWWARLCGKLDARWSRRGLIVEGNRDGHGRALETGARRCR